MQLYFYGMCGLVSIFGLHSTTGYMSILPDHSLILQHQSKKEGNKPEQNNNDLKKLTLQDIVSITTSDLESVISVKPKPLRCTKHKGKRKDVVLKALKQILENKTGKTHEFHKNNNIDKVKDIKSISASDLVKVTLAKPQSKKIKAKPEKVNKKKTKTKPEKVNKRSDEMDDDTDSVRDSDLDLLANIEPKIFAKTTIKNTEIYEIKNAKSSISFDNPGKENTRTDEMNIAKSKSKIYPLPDTETKPDEMNSKTRSKREVKPKKPLAKIDAINNGRDIVLEVVKQLIKEEKTRRHFDMVNPPNTKYSKRQQLLWDRLRVKAAAEVLLNPIPMNQKPTERMFDNLKIDLELETPEPTLEPGLFNDFKKRVEKEFYMDAYEKQLLKTREFISTLKPRVESYFR